MNLNRVFRLRLPRFGRRKGFTLVEVLIAASISTMIMMMIASLQLLSAKAIKDLYNKTRTRAAQMRALDQIRYRLMSASLSSIVVDDGDDDLGYREIQFEDPMLAGAVSSFFFDADTNILYYDDDIDDGSDNMDGYEDGNDEVEGMAVAKGPIDVRFFPQNMNATVRLFIKSEAYVAAKLVEQEAVAEGEEPPPPVYSVVDEQEGEITVWLRNK